MKKFLLGVALGALVATAFRVVVVTPDTVEDETDNTLSTRDRARIGDAVQRRFEVQDADEPSRDDRVRSALRSMAMMAALSQMAQTMAQRRSPPNFGDGVEVEVLSGDEAKAFMDEHLPGLREAIEARGGRVADMKRIEPPRERAGEDATV